MVGVVRVVGLVGVVGVVVYGCRCESVQLLGCFNMMCNYHFNSTSYHSHSHCTSQLDLFILLMVVITFTVLKAGLRQTKVRCAVSGNLEVKFVLILLPHTLYELIVVVVCCLSRFVMVCMSS